MPFPAEPPPPHLSSPDYTRWVLASAARQDPEKIRKLKQLQKNIVVPFRLSSSPDPK